jgi:hypothetical protein
MSKKKPLNKPSKNSTIRHNSIHVHLSKEEIRKKLKAIQTKLNKSKER